MALNFIGSIRPYMEVAYFAAGVFLLFGLLITYRQVAIIKNDIRIRNERAAKERAIEAVLRYTKNFVDAYDNYYANLKTQKLDFYSGPIGDFSSNSIPRHILPATIRRMTKSHLVLNELEAIAAYFVSGIAHEHTGFLIIGRSFCSCVGSMYDTVSAYRTERAHPYWYNIVELYQMWRPRLTKAEMENSIKELEAKIKGLAPEKTVDPVGT